MDKTEPRPCEVRNCSGRGTYSKLYSKIGAGESSRDRKNSGRFEVGEEALGSERCGDIGHPDNN